MVFDMAKINYEVPKDIREAFISGLRASKHLNDAERAELYSGVNPPEHLVGFLMAIAFRKDEK